MSFNRLDKVGAFKWFMRNVFASDNIFLHFLFYSIKLSLMLFSRFSSECMIEHYNSQAANWCYNALSSAPNHKAASSMIELYNSQSSIGVSLLYHRRPACLSNVRAKIYLKPIYSSFLYHNNHKAS